MARLYKLGGSDPRTGGERLAAIINRGVQPATLKKQARSWDDTPEVMAANKKAAKKAKKP